MIRKLAIYLDTSVPNAYLDFDRPERQMETKDFWNRMNQYEAYISDFVLKEINKTQEQKRKDDLLSLVKPFKVLNGETDEVKELVQNYVSSGAIAILEDAIHVAITVIHGIGILVSWNYKHLVNLKTKRDVNAVNLMKGYNPIEIADPSMV
jgi:predicted nucleic acid-binding protein